MTKQTAQKKLYVKTWGCQMNVYDTRRMTEVLKPLGYAASETPEDADFIILNTCHIREKATEKVFSELGRLKKHKDRKEKDGGKMLMAVAGCVAQAEGDVITDRAPYVDMVFGPQVYHELPEMVLKATGGERNLINTEFPTEAKFDTLPEETQSNGPVGFIAVQEGCDKFCTFCVVPYTRGAEYSRPMASVIEETRRLVESGAKEVQFLGQNVNAYHGAGKDGKTASLAELIHEAAQINGLERIRYTTSHPRDMSDDLYAVHGEVEKLMPFLHLPVQSGSNKILKTMNRKHEVDLYHECIARLRAARPDIAFSSDFIIGFPGETEEDHQDTLKLIETVGYASAYSFIYSSRPGTPGAVMQGQVREDVKKRRLQEVQALLNRQQYEYNQSFEGQILPVLFERAGHKGGNQIIGRTPHWLSVTVEGNPRLMGEILPVRITRGAPKSLNGELVMAEELVAA